MSSRLRASARLSTAVAIVTAYVALHLAISAGLDLRACDRFHDAPARAAAFTAALDQYAAGEMSARAEIRAGDTWFKENAPPGAGRSTVSAATGDVEKGRVSLARERAAGLAADVERDRARLDRKLGSSRATALYWAVPAALLLGVALWLRRQRRSGAAEIISVVSWFALRQPWWQRPLFLLASGAGYVLFAAGFFAVSTAQRRGYTMPPITMVGLLVGGLAAAGAGVLSLRYTRPRAARGAAQALLADGRRPVLYLRSFADDETAAQVDDSSAFVSIHSREEQLTGALGAVGPVITVGRPGEPLPRLGAARFYLPLDDWQPTVLRLMELSQLIVLRLGLGEGLWWEVQQARATQPARKLVLLAPGGLPDLVERLDEYLPTPSGLAEIAGNDPWTGAVITFDAEWTPQVHPVGPVPRAALPRGALLRRGARAVKAGWTVMFMYTPAHHLARAIKDALASVGIRKRTMAWRAIFALQTSLWKGFALVTALALLGWLVGRALQLVGIS
ncbi:transferase [Streptomyces malaysiense]|uniref:Transferase n=1 Tax=Streptomyces malaysiense TaxID=1428626 RepID=A0A1J4PZ32_9ACTN|nr:transferase [Streptomyces malaysiense]OIK25540.1 transferase [Streptomyces malaysiense]